MDFIEKARIRIKRWIEHNMDHEKEYEKFVDELDQAGMNQSAEFIREMIEFSKKQTEALKKALNALDKRI